MATLQDPRWIASGRSTQNIYAPMSGSTVLPFVVFDVDIVRGAQHALGEREAEPRPGHGGEIALCLYQPLFAGDVAGAVATEPAAFCIGNRSCFLGIAEFLDQAVHRRSLHVLVDAEL